MARKRNGTTLIEAPIAAEKKFFKKEFLEGRKNALEEKLKKYKVDEVKRDLENNGGKGVSEITKIKQQRFVPVLEKAWIKVSSDLKDGSSTYGICTKCGKMIEEERLLAIAEAEICTKCIPKPLPGRIKV